VFKHIVILLALLVTSCSGTGAIGSVAPADNTPVNPEIVAQLTTELNRQLSTAGFPNVHPPSAGDTSFTLTSENEGNILHFRWKYSNPGDYDQNGVVNIHDITPIARYWHRPTVVAPEDVDGNNDGLIDIADLSVIGAYYNSTVSAYFIQALNSEDKWTDVQGFSFSFGTHQWPTDPLYYDTHLPASLFTDAKAFRIVSEDSEHNRSKDSETMIVAGMPAHLISLTPLPTASTTFILGEEVEFTPIVSGLNSVELTWDLHMTNWSTIGAGDANPFTVTMHEVGDFFLNLTVVNAFGSESYSYPIHIVDLNPSSGLTISMNPNSAVGREIDADDGIVDIGTWDLVVGGDQTVVVDQLVIRIYGPNSDVDVLGAQLWYDDGTNPGNFSSTWNGVVESGTLIVYLTQPLIVDSSPQQLSLHIQTGLSATPGHTLQASMEAVSARDTLGNTVFAHGLPCALNLFTIQ
jgi:hypothetical protein